jgi:hypothetical protein
MQTPAAPEGRPSQSVSQTVKPGNLRLQPKAETSRRLTDAAMPMSATRRREGSCPCNQRHEVSGR